MSAFPAGLGVVVLAYGSPAPAAQLVDHVVAEGVSADRVLVVHNGAPAGSTWPGDERVAVRDTRGNLGYAGGMNVGLRERLDHGDELVLLLTHDAAFAPGAIRALHEAAVRHPELGLLGPRLDDPVRGVVFSLGVDVDWSARTMHRHALPPHAGDVVGCDALDGAFMLVRADAVRRAGPFDEGFFMYYEETEFALRVRRAGLGVAVVPAARAEQEGGESRRPGVFAYLRIRNGFVFSWRAAGVVGLAAWAVRTILYFGMYFRRLPDPRRSPAAKAAARAAVTGVLLGARDAVLGRRGAPPSSLPGMGDVRL